MAVRARQNQALQFTVLLDNGALFTGLPLHAISTKMESPKVDLGHSQMWDCISDDIDCFVINNLLYAECDVKTDAGVVHGKYHFTIDFVGHGYSRHPTHWKQLHLIETDLGNMLLYPQYRIRFTDKALYDGSSLPAYKANSRHWIVGS